MKSLLVVTSAIEAGAGLALLGFPSATVSILLGSASDAAPPLIVVRAVGAVLLALGIACWFASRDAQKPCAGRMVMVMTAYNLGAALALGIVGMRTPAAGILLWPAVALHAAMALWCAGALAKRVSAGAAEAK